MLLIAAGLCGSIAALLLVGALALGGGTNVRLLLDGQTYDLRSRTTTVGALLREAGVTLLPGDVAVPAPDAPLTPDMTVTVTRAREVLLTVAGRTEVRRTTQTTPAQILDEAGITLAPADRVLVDGTDAAHALLAAWTVPARRIVVQRALTLRVDDDGTLSDLVTTQGTVGEALYAAGIVVYLSDSVVPALRTPVGDGMTVTIRRARPLTVQVDGTTLDVRSGGATVGDALALAGVTLVGLDFTQPDEGAPLVPGMTVRVVRVTESVLAQTTALPFDLVYQPDAALALDARQTVQAGQSGLRRVTVRVRYEDGVEVSRQTEDDFVLRAPQNGIVAYGTNVTLQTVDTPDGALQYWRRLRMYATSYHPAALGGDNVTATGRTLTRGIVAIDPDIIPYGTQVYVAGYGVGLAADTGGPRSSPYWIDLGYDDANWVSWSRYVDVYVLAPVPASVNYLLPEWTPIR